MHTHRGIFMPIFTRMKKLPKNKTYEEFVEKFKPKLTTDDCMTPPEVYDTVRDWVCEEYGIDQAGIIRPFWPGEDYQTQDYPEGCVVLDNPPFSILSTIIAWYQERGIRFFLFAPTLTAFSGRKNLMDVNHIVCDCNIEYENGAIVPTSFVSNLTRGIVAQSCPELTRRVNATVERLRKQKTRCLPKYQYPDNVITAGIMRKYSKYGVDLKIMRGDCVPVSSLDAQKPLKKAIFGGGLLLSEKAAAEKAAAEKAAAEKAAAEKAAVTLWTLSERELAIVKSLS